MLGKRLNFHTAYEVMAAVKLALFTFPALRQPLVEDEARKWNTLLRVISPRDCSHEALHAAAIEFEDARGELEQKNSAVGRYCAGVAILCSVVLAVATYSADEPANRVVAWEY